MAVRRARCVCIRNEGKVLLPLPKGPLLWGSKVLLSCQAKNELFGGWSAKIKYFDDLVTTALAVSSSPSFTSGQRVKTGSEAKREGSGNGPGGHRAQETHKQARTAARKEPRGGGGRMKKGGGEGKGGNEAMAVCLVLLPLWLILSASALASSQSSSFAAWPPRCLSRSVVRL